MRQLLSRGVLTLVTLLVVILYYVPIGHVDFAENWGEGTFGITLPLRTTTVVGVARGSPADRAGIRVGDRFAPAKLRNRFAQSERLIRASAKGLAFERGGTAYTVTLTARSNPEFGLLQRIGGVLAYMPPTVFLIVAFLLVFLRPSIMSWSFYVFAVGYFGTSPVFMYWSHVLSPAAYLVLSFVLSTDFRPMERVAAAALRSAISQRRRVGMAASGSIGSSGPFSRLTYVLYVSSGAATRQQDRFRAWDIFPGTVIPLGRLCFGRFDTCEELRHRDAQRPPKICVRGTRYADIVRGVRDLFRPRRTVRRWTSHRLRSRAHADLHRLRGFPAAGTRRQLRAQSRVGLCVLSARGDRVHLDLRLVLFSHRRNRPAGDRGRAAGHDCSWLSARSNQSHRRGARRGAFLPSAPARGAATAPCCGSASICNRRRGNRRWPRADSRRRNRARRRRALSPLRKRSTF